MYILCTNSTINVRNILNIDFTLLKPYANIKRLTLRQV